ncbi:MAG: type and secretion system protein [Edaphobacter sp.]|nr:type and secretion system protein [Edaphobacter sp.]
MKCPSQYRAAAITRRTAVSVIVCLSMTALAQEPVTPPPQGAGSTSQSSAATEAARTIPQPPGKRQSQAAEDAYLAGAQLLDRNNLAGAEAQFAKAQRLNPTSSEYALAVALAREHRVTELIHQSGKARLLGQSGRAEALLAEARRLDPQNSIVTQHAGAPSKTFNPQITAGPEPWIKEGPSLAGPVALLPDANSKSFHIHSDVQDVVRQVISSYGIRPVFDESVPRQSVRFDLEDTSYQQAVPILLRMAGLFAVPLDPKSVLIAKDTTANRQRLERQLEETIYVPGMTPEEMGELGNIIRNVFDVKQATVQNSGGTIAIRAPEETVNAINLTLADMIDGGAQIMLDLNIYAVDQTRQRNVGVQLPQQIGVYSVAGAAHNLVSSNQALVNQGIAQGLIPAGASELQIALALIASGLVQSSLLSSTIGFFGGGVTLAGVTTNVGTTVNFGLSSSDTRALDNIQLRVGDRQAANFRVGSRYPITTSTYSSGLSATPASLAGVTINGVSAASLLGQANSITIPQIQYEDLGLTLKATPTVQKSGQIRMHLELKIEALAGSALNNIPILASRQYTSDVTIADGESTLLLSSLTKSESAAVSGIPGISELPGFQTATADKIRETDSSELVLILTPHIIRHRSNVTAGPRIALNLPQQSN